MKRNYFSCKSAQQGVVLVEAMVAILLFSVGVLAVVGLQASMLRNVSDTQYRAGASYLAQQMIGQMWADPVNTAAGVYNVVSHPADLPNGTMNVTQIAVGAPYVITVGWTAPGDTPATDWISQPCFMPVAHCYITSATITSY